MMVWFTKYGYIHDVVCICRPTGLSVDISSCRDTVYFVCCSDNFSCSYCHYILVIFRTFQVCALPFLELVRWKYGVSWCAKSGISKSPAKFKNSYKFYVIWGHLCIKNGELWVNPMLFMHMLCDGIFCFLILIKWYVFHVLIWHRNVVLLTLLVCTT